MRIYISLDAEGATGLCDFSEVEPKSSLYHRGISAMEHDLQAVLSGAREAGATEFYICDAHENGTNLSLEDLGEDVRVVRGTGHPLSMMAGVDLAQFDGAFFIAYHAKNESGGVMGHTYFPGVVKKAFVLDHEVGEFGLNVPVAWAFGIPALLASGDDVFLEEVRAVSSRTERCRVKEALGSGCALCLDGSRTAEELHACAKRAVMGYRSAKPPVAIKGDIVIQYETAAQAEKGAAYGDPLEENRVAYRCETYLMAFERAIAGMVAAAEAEKGERE